MSTLPTRCEAVSHHVRLLEIVAAFIPSLATLGTTWSGCQAAKMDGDTTKVAPGVRLPVIKR